MQARLACDLPGKLLGERFRQITREARLHQCRAGHYRDAGSRREIQNAIRESLRHGEIERELHKTEMMLRAADFGGYFDQARQIERGLGRGRSETFPGGSAILADLAIRNKCFELRECQPDAPLELFAAHGA